MKVELSGGGWATLRDGCSNGGRRKAIAAYAAGFDKGNGAVFLAEMGMYDALAVDMVEEWSLPLPVPKVRADVMDELAREDANAIYTALHELVPSLKPVDFDPDVDAESPTSPSSA